MLTLSISTIMSSTMMFWYLRSTMAATVSLSGLIRVGPNTTPRLLAFIRLAFELSATLCVCECVRHVCVYMQLLYMCVCVCMVCGVCVHGVWCVCAWCMVCMCMVCGVYVRGVCVHGVWCVVCVCMVCVCMVCGVW